MKALIFAVFVVKVTIQSGIKRPENKINTAFSCLLKESFFYRRCYFEESDCRFVFTYKEISEMAVKPWYKIMPVKTLIKNHQKLL